MEKRSYVNTIFIFSLIGVLFSGYLTFAKLVLDSCPLTEGCPYFLGYPACVYGLVLFLILFITVISLMKNYTKEKLKILVYVSLIGVIFSTYTSIVELVYPSCLDGICKYSLLLPTCVYGLVMYLVIFVLSLKLYKK